MTPDQGRALIAAARAAGRTDQEISALLAKAQGTPSMAGRRAQLEEQLARTRARGEELAAEGSPSLIGEMGSEMATRAKRMGHGVVSLVDAVMHPIDTATSPAKRRQLERGVADTVTGGYATSLADKALEAVRWFQGAKQDAEGRTGQPTFASTEAADEAAAPDLRTGGQFLGMAMPGAGRTIAQNATGAARELIPAGTSALGRAASAAGRAAVSYDIAAPVMAATHADAGGVGDRLRAAKEAVTDPIGVLTASALAAGGAAARDKVAKTRGAAAVRTLEAQPAAAERVAKMGPADDKLIGKASRVGAEGVVERMKFEDKMGRKLPYQGVKSVIDAKPEAHALRDASDVVQLMRDATYDLGTDDAVTSKLDRQLSKLERYRDPETGNYMVPEYQLNGLRQNLMRVAKVGQTDSPAGKEAPLRAAAFAVKKLVDEGPYGDLNRFYAEESAALTERRQDLGLKKTLPKETETDIRKVKLGLERRGQNTKTAGGDTKLDEFVRKNPQYAEDVGLAEAAQARADLTPHLTPHHGGLVERTMGAHLGPAAILLGLAHGGLPGLATAAGMLALQNGTPIAGQLYRATRGMGTGAAGAGIGLMDPLQAAMQRRKKEGAHP